MAIKVYDADGNERDLQWAINKYRVSIDTDEAPEEEDRWIVAKLHEVIGPASMTVRTLPPTKGISVYFAWPEGQVKQETDGNGQTGFGMGGGAYYHPEKGEPGPHSVWIDAPCTEIINGLGMIAGTNHNHLEPTFKFVEAEEGAEPEPDPNLAMAIAILEDIKRMATAALEAVKGMGDFTRDVPEPSPEANYNTRVVSKWMTHEQALRVLNQCPPGFGLEERNGTNNPTAGI